MKPLAANLLMLVLLVGGLFLIEKSTHEIYTKFEGPESPTNVQRAASLAGVLIQIMLLFTLITLAPEIAFPAFSAEADVGDEFLVAVGGGVDDLCIEGEAVELVGGGERVGVRMLRGD